MTLTSRKHSPMDMIYKLNLYRTNIWVEASKVILLFYRTHRHNGPIAVRYVDH